MRAIRSPAAVRAALESREVPRPARSPSRTPLAALGVARARVAGPGDVEHVLFGGDLIGRGPHAALDLDDPRVSEAHAIVSLRAGALHLLSLRRMFAIERQPVSQVRLVPGLVIELAERLLLRVVDVEAPTSILTVTAPGRLPRPLPPVASLVAGPPPALVPRFVPDAAVHLWAAGDAWRVREGEGEARALAIDDVFTVGGERFAIGLVPARDAGPMVTEPGRGGFDPLRLVAAYDRVELHRRQQEVVVIGGIGARLISELVACAGPLSWEVLARQLWPDAGSHPDLRHRWDVALNRLRTRLREAGIRADLLHSDRSGQVGLVLHTGDEVDDRT